MAVKVININMIPNDPVIRRLASSDSKDIIKNHVNDKKEVVGDPSRSENFGIKIMYS